jgi:hypothetical protein
MIQKRSLRQPVLSCPWAHLRNCAAGGGTQAPGASGAGLPGGGALGGGASRPSAPPPPGPRPPPAARKARSPEHAEPPAPPSRARDPVQSGQNRRPRTAAGDRGPALWRALPTGRGTERRPGRAGDMQRDGGQAAGQWLDLRPPPPLSRASCFPQVEGRRGSPGWGRVPICSPARLCSLAPWAVPKALARNWGLRSWPGRRPARPLAQMPGARPAPR